MQHIKDYWKESEVFHASNLNEIARTINELIDASEISVIDDEQISSGSTYSSAKIVEMIEGAGFHVAVVDELPVVGEHNTIYFVPSSDPKEKDVTDEFIWCDGEWEQIGSTRVDFSNYYTKREIDDTVDVIEGMISEKADVLHEHQMEDVSGLTETLEEFSETVASRINEIENTLDTKQNKINDLDDIRSGASLGATALQSESDPTVPAWAKTPNKPTYTASEVGALPSSTTIPSKTSQLTNDSGFLTEHQQLKTVNGESLVGTGNVTIIDNTQASPQKAYSSSKIEELLKAPTVDEVIDILNEPEPYDEGYEHGSTDSYSGETQNPYSAGTYSYTEWNNGYEDGWEDTHPEPQIEMHYWFVYSGDAETNGVVIDGDMFTGMITGTSSMNSSFEVEGVIYTTTKRSSDAATFGNIVIPSGKTATVYLAAVSSGAAARKVLLINDATGYSGELNIEGGSSSLRVATLTDVQGGLTYKLSRNGNENVRVSALIIKLQ